MESFAQLYAVHFHHIAQSTTTYVAEYLDSISQANSHIVMLALSSLLNLFRQISLSNVMIAYL